MMLQPGVSPDSGDAAAASAQPHELSAAAAAAGAAADFSEDERGRTEDGGRNSGGNRWPRQETLYLLKIRQDMDVAFRDSTLKGPLWDEVSRKLASLGFHRSAKKCKEKFENVYKYHKRIKEGRTSKSDGKTYKFFDQLEALEASPAAGNHHHQPPLSLPPPPPLVLKPPQVSPMTNTPVPAIPPGVITPVNMTAVSVSVSHQNNVDPISVAAPAVAMPPAVNVNHVARFPFSQLNMSGSTNSSDSSTSSEDEPPEKRRSRKRKWEEFFGRLMKEVIDKQEELQSKFLDSLERRERDRAAREEAWRMQEMAKMKREHDLLVQERSMVAAKDAAVITFLQKITDSQNPNPNAVIPQVGLPAPQLFQQQQQNNPPAPAPPPPPLPESAPPSVPQQPLALLQPQQTPPPLTAPLAAPAIPVSVQTPALPPPMKSLDNGGGVGENMLQPSPSRWPKAEINALIQIRTSLDTKYQEGGPKGPLWEEVSAAMRNLGYNRNAKRCKEKWENINKYYKKVKESSKKRPDDSKTCPYFHQLDAIYREKAAGSGNGNSNSNNNNNSNPSLTVKPESQMAPIMARPEQQWPLPAAVQEHQHHHQYHHHQNEQQQSKVNEPRGIEDHRNTDLNDDDYDDDEEEDDDEDEEGGEYEIVPNKTSSMAAVE
ncbi:hypothetical protein SSX86_008607 [Deinandra increscens subsp. villosa]|uniref:Myb-like domain-containing protein n=1 Tax=Deinandra increscens subsp. villosa TaxID=3103831 RepID=A0AAP0DBL1_9ASTR